MKTILFALILTSAVIAVISICSIAIDLVLAPIPTPLIVAGLAVCVILLAAVVLAAIKGMQKTFKP